MKLYVALFVTLICLGLLDGCGYLPTLAKGTTTIAIPIFDNQTFWRGDEFELTNLVNNEILSRRPDYQVISNPTRADLLLQGTITNLTKPVLVEGQLARTVQSQVVITLRVIVKDQRTGKVIYEGARSEPGEFAGQRAENEDSARRKAYEKLARWVATIMEPGS